MPPESFATTAYFGVNAFAPNNVPPGIEPVDPMIEVRSAAYPISFGERQ
jgi:catalase